MIRFLPRLLFALLVERPCERIRPKPRYRMTLKPRVFWADPGVLSPLGPLPRDAPWPDGWREVPW